MSKKKLKKIKKALKSAMKQKSNYSFVAKINRRILFDEMIKEDI